MLPRLLLAALAALAAAVDEAPLAAVDEAPLAAVDEAPLAAVDEAALPPFADMAHRHRTVRPGAGQVGVAAVLTLVDVDVDEAHSAARLSGWLHLRWVAPGLAWADGPAHTRVHPADFWTPDLVPFNAVSLVREPWLDERALAVVNRTGGVMYVPRFSFEVRCRRAVTADTDRFACPFKLGSWTHNHAELDLVAERDHVDLSQLVANGRWAVESSSVTRQQDLYDCCPDMYDSLEVELVLKPQHA